MNQLRLICAMKRRIHGPNSTPLVSNWIAGPNCAAAAARVVELIALHVALQVLQRVAERAARNVAERPLAPFCGGVGGRGTGNCIVDCESGSFWRSSGGAGCAFCARWPAAGFGRRPLAARRLALLGLDALGRVAARERQRVGRLRRPLGRLRPSDPCPTARRDRAASAPARSMRGCDEHEASAARFCRCGERQRARARRGGRVRHEQPRRQQHDDDHRQVDDDRQQNAFAPGDRPADRRDVRAIILEIEIHQAVTASIPTGGYALEVGRLAGIHHPRQVGRGTLVNECLHLAARLAATSRIQKDDAEGQRAGRDVDEAALSQNCHKLVGRRERADRRRQVAVRGVVARDERGRCAAARG